MKRLSFLHCMFLPPLSCPGPYAAQQKLTQPCKSATLIKHKFDLKKNQTWPNCNMKTGSSEGSIFFSRIFKVTASQMASPVHVLGGIMCMENKSVILEAPPPSVHGGSMTVTWSSDLSPSEPLARSPLNCHISPTRLSPWAYLTLCPQSSKYVFLLFAKVVHIDGRIFVQ